MNILKEYFGRPLLLLFRHGVMYLVITFIAIFITGLSITQYEGANILIWSLILLTYMSVIMLITERDYTVGRALSFEIVINTIKRLVPVIVFIVVCMFLINIFLTWSGQLISSGEEPLKNTAPEIKILLLFFPTSMMMSLYIITTTVTKTWFLLPLVLLEGMTFKQARSKSKEYHRECGWHLEAILVSILMLNLVILLSLSAAALILLFVLPIIPCMMWHTLRTFVVPTKIVA